MILRRVIEHVRTQNWTAIVLDFVIVVVGVFMGIQLGNWNQERLDRQEEVALVERIRVDFDRIKEDSDRSLAYHKQLESDLRTMVRSLRVGTLEDEDLAGFERALVVGFAFQTSADNPGSFRELMSSGRASILRDRQLLDALVDYEDFLERFGFAQEYYRDMAMHTFGPYTSAFHYNVDMRLTEEVFANGSEAASVVSYDFDALAADPAFANAAEQLLFVHSGIILWRSRISQRVDDIRLLLKDDASGDEG